MGIDGECNKLNARFYLFYANVHVFLKITPAYDRPLIFIHTKPLNAM